MKKKNMQPPGREPTIYGLKGHRANHYATESTASRRKNLLDRTGRNFCCFRQ